MPPTRIRDLRSLVLPLLGAVVVGLGAGLAPTWTVLLVGGALAAALLLWRVELAALAVVVGSLFDDHLVDHLVDHVPSVSEVLAVVLVASWVVRRIRGPLHTGPRSRVTDAVVVFLVVLLLATFVHPNGRAGLEVLLRWTGLVVVTLVLVEVLRGPLAPRRAALAYVAAAALASVLGLVACLALGETRVTGPVGDPDDLAFALLAALPLALVLRGWHPEGQRHGRLVDRGLELAVVLMLLAIVGTLSRGALVGLAVMLLVGLVTRLLSAPVVVGVVAVLLIGAGLASVVVPDLVSTSLRQGQVGADDDAAARLHLWQEASTMTLENPVLGLGPGAFALDHLDHRRSQVADPPVALDVAHGTWLETSSELGLVGLLALLAVLVGGAGAAWSRWRRDREPLAAGVCAALVGTMVAATFVTVQHALPLWLLVALGAALGARDDRRLGEGPTAAVGEHR